jgi:hypothetical protein
MALKPEGFSVEVRKVIGDHEPERAARPRWPRLLAWTIEGIYQVFVAWLIIVVWQADSHVNDPLSPAAFLLGWVLFGAGGGVPVFFVALGAGNLCDWMWRTAERTRHRT